MKTNQLEKVEKILVVIDEINGFMKEGPLADSSIQRIIPETIALIEQFMKNADPIITVRDAHTINDAEFQNYPIHCLKGSVESELIAPLKKYQDYYLDFEKQTTDALSVLELKKLFIRMIHLKKIVVTGCCTDICVKDFLYSVRDMMRKLNRDVTLVISEQSVDTFQLPDHDKEMINQAMFKEFKENGIQVVKRYERRTYNGEK